jgi:hypothetical protein
MNPECSLKSSEFRGEVVSFVIRIQYRSKMSLPCLRPDERLLVADG